MDDARTATPQSNPDFRIELRAKTLLLFVGHHHELLRERDYSMLITLAPGVKFQCRKYAIRSAIS
jgi:hypothetical protein